RIAGFRVQSANHYTIEPSRSLGRHDVTLKNTMLSKHCPLLFFPVRTYGSNSVTFSHLADAFVQSNEQGKELVDANWKAVLSTEHISHLTQNPRSYRDLNSDRWIQSPECYALTQRTS